MSYQYSDRFSPSESAGNKSMKNALLSVFTFLLVVVMFGFGCKFSTDVESQNETVNSNSSVKGVVTPERENDETKAVSSREIVEAFGKDKDAKRLYRGKTVTIRGKITNINDVFGMSNINLRDSENEIGLVCYLKNAGDKNKVKIGDTVIVRAEIEDTDVGVVSKAEILKIN